MSMRAADFFLVREATDATPLARVNAADDGARPSELQDVFTGEMRSALWLASPDLVAALDSSGDDTRVQDALYRYLVRACTRCNPFGAFTAVSLGRFGARAGFDAVQPVQRIVRLDGSLVATILHRVNSRRVRLTSPFYRCEREFRYVTTRPAEGRVPRYILSAAEDDAALSFVAENARDACDFDCLAEKLSAFASVTVEEAAAYIEQLRKSGVLVSALESLLTGDHDFATLERDLIEARDPAGAALAEARRIAAGIGAGLISVADGAAAIRIAAGAHEHRISEVVQVDSVRLGGDTSLPESVASDVATAARAFYALKPERIRDPLADFKCGVTERWGDAAVPLTTALDADFGVPLTALDARPSRSLAAGLRALRMAERVVAGGDPRFVERAIVAAQRHAEEIEVTAEDLARAPAPQLPSAFTAVCSIDASGDDAIDGGQYRVIIKAFASGSAVRLLGRFCGLVPCLSDHVAALVRGAAEPGVIDADVVHCPSPRESNVVRRDRIYDHEIAITGRGSAPPERTIRVEDLLVSVHDREIALWDAKRGLRVRPHLSVAHNHGAPTNLALYRFLCLLEEQDSIVSGEWSWGPLAREFAMPRLRIGRAILSHRRWMIAQDVQREVMRASSTIRAVDLLRRWQEQSGCPDEILAGGIEERVTLDLSSAPARRFFARLVREGHREVREALPSRSGHAYRASGTRVAHEIVIPYRRTTPGVVMPAAPVRIPARRAASTWRYLKFYCAPSWSNDVIAAAAAVLRRAIAKRSVDRWFFIRYSDPEAHVRVRFRGRSAALLGEVERQLERELRTFVESGRIWRVQRDVYVPEPVRYGGENALAYSEELFWRDSECVVEALGRTTGEPDWVVCMASIDAIARDFGLNLLQRMQFARARRDAYFQEFRDVDGLRRHAAAIVREHRTRVISSLASPGVLAPIFDVRSHHTARAVARILAAERAGKLTVTRNDLLASLVHMTANRIFAEEPRMQEALTLDLLAAGYAAMAATRKECR